MNFTTLALVRFVPVIVTAAPQRPVVGARVVMVGAGGMTVKEVLLVAVPPGVVTVRVPVVAPAGTVVVIDVAETTVKVGCAVPLNFTALALVKLVPVIVTAAPTRPLGGLKDVIVGAGMTVKGVVLVPGPPAVVTVMLPVVAPAGTVVVIDVAETTVKVA